jgi:hypothetical protein
MRRRVCVLLAAVAMVLQGCATGTGFSQLVGERYFLTRLDTHPVIIISVAGRSLILSTQYVEPGLRVLVLQGPPGGAGISALETFELQVKPCMRYYIVAVKTSPLDSNFKPQVDFMQPLAGC